MGTGKWGSFDGWFHWGRDFYMGILYPFRGQVLFNSIQAIYILRDQTFLVMWWGLDGLGPNSYANWFQLVDPGLFGGSWIQH